MPKNRCATRTLKPCEDGLERDFNSLDAQYEACAACIASQSVEGWLLLPGRYNDGGLSGGTMDRPALQRLLPDIDAGRLDWILVQRIGRLTRAQAEFAKIVEQVDASGGSFVSVTQSFNVATSMGRLTHNLLSCFAQCECEDEVEKELHAVPHRTPNEVAASSSP